jgi:Flp pilus assembly protein TadD
VATEFEYPPDTLLMRHLNRAQAAQKVGDRNTASKHYALALQLDPDCAGALNNLALLLVENNYHVTAEVCARRAAALRPDSEYIIATCAAILSNRGASTDARDVYFGLIERYPDNALFWHGLGVAQAIDDVATAIRHLEHARELASDNNVILRNLGMTRLAVQDWDRGFSEWRQSGLDTTEDAAFSVLSQWRGENLDGKTLVVHHEQGYGDTIQFCRFLRLIEGHVILATPAPLVRLMRMSGVADEVIDFADPAPEHADYQIPLMFAWAYRSIQGAWDDGRTPYLTAPANGPRVNRAQGALLVVGICWAGNPNYNNDARRSMTFEDLLPLASIPGVQLVSLQKGDRAADVGKIGAGALVQDVSGQVGDFADLAYVIKQLDVVVSVDTAPLHLAGALSVPSIALLPRNRCWRWGRDTDRSPFYPSMKLLTQSKLGDWTEVLADVRAAIVDMIGDRRVEPEPQEKFEQLEIV